MTWQKCNMVIWSFEANFEKLTQGITEHTLHLLKFAKQASKPRTFQESCTNWRPGKNEPQRITNWIFLFHSILCPYFEGYQVKLREDTALSFFEWWCFLLFHHIYTFQTISVSPFLSSTQSLPGHFHWTIPSICFPKEVWMSFQDLSQWYLPDSAGKLKNILE